MYLWRVSGAGTRSAAIGWHRRHSKPHSQFARRKKPPLHKLRGFLIYRYNVWLKRFKHLIQCITGITEQHACVIQEEQWILHTGIASGHAAFEND